MLGTPAERERIAEGLAKTRGASWTFASEELRNCEVDNAIKQKEMAERLQARGSILQPSVLDTSHVTAADHSSNLRDGDPREGLESAKAELAMAEVERDEAGEVVDRALQRLAKAEADVAEYEGLDERIDAWHISETRSGRVADMPYSLIAASREKAAATDRLEHANRAQRKLSAELKSAEQRVQQRQREVSVWAQRVMVQEHAEAKAAKREALLAEADELGAELEALFVCSFPSAGGLPPITPSIMQALNRQSRPRTEHAPLLLEPHKQQWMKLHAKLLEDSES
jgi:hypothetical protein